METEEENAEGQQEDNHNSNKTHNLQKSEDYYKNKQKLVGTSKYYWGKQKEWFSYKKHSN